MKWTFEPPEHREDGSILDPADIDYYIATLDNGDEYIIPGDATEVDIPVSDGVHCLTLVTVVKDGQASEDSNTVCKEQDTELAPPMPPIIDDDGYDPDVITPNNGAKNVPVDSTLVAEWEDATEVNVEIVVFDSNGNKIVGETS